ncbi:MAG: CBS domain-containing protein [Hyphomicrobiaceae bacterium]|nr:CBS domain-containing protein [Hyphomicrobiaceae bacterium]
MSIGTYLGSHQSMVISCRPEDSVKSAATLLTSNKIGAMPVLDEAGKLVGLLSERDIVRVFATNTAEIMTMLVGELMSRNPVTCNKEDGMDRAMQLMKRHRFRHLPVMDGDELFGIVSIRDALAAMAQAKELEANVMRDISIASRSR